jgi:transcriptional regulator with GAF, ATPase, and Fis domain
VLLEKDERALLEAAVDEAVAATRAERAFLLRRRLDRPSGNVVIVARNLDRESLRRARRSSFSRSVADQVITTERSIVTAMASEDPRLQGKRSIIDLGVRSILCVPVRGPQGVIGALYLDHRFHEGRFGEAAVELIQAIADVIGLALENARLHREAGERAEQLARANEAVSRENARRALEIERLADRLARAGDAEPEQAGGIVGRDRALLSAINIARRVAPSDLPLLVAGESGTGKELLARFVHDQSLRSGGPFLAINCGSIPEPLLESELFGHVRGAFTGADRDYPGLFRSARGGTVLLDEIGEMPLGMQTRILRVLQEREVVPVGSTDPIGLDVRVIAATNRKLEEEVEAGRFRKDLYFRLVGAVVDLPPLRERIGDIPILARHELSKIAAEPGMRKLTLSREALVAMVAHSWPGNVRELFNALRRAVLVAEGDEIRSEDLGTATGGVPRREALRKYDEQLVTAALKAAGGNRTAAARSLGVSRMTVHRWIKRYGLDI